jgi:hypothetical protein
VEAQPPERTFKQACLLLAHSLSGCHCLLLLSYRTAATPLQCPTCVCYCSADPVPNDAALLLCSEAVTAVKRRHALAEGMQRHLAPACKAVTAAVAAAALFTPAACACVEELDELIAVHVQQLVQVHTPAGQQQENSTAAARECQQPATVFDDSRACTYYTQLLHSKDKGWALIQSTLLNAASLDSARCRRLDTPEVESSKERHGACCMVQSNRVATLLPR